MNWRLNPAVFVLVLIALIGCSRTAGEGGTTTIQGSVEVEKRLVIVNPASAQAPHPAADQDVFIIYGDRILVVACICGRFENHRRLVGNLCATHPAKQFFGFSRKHGTANDFNAAFAEASVLQRGMFFVWDHHDCARNYFRHYFAPS